jgi:hypothetical protein
METHSLPDKRSVSVYLAKVVCPLTHSTFSKTVNYQSSRSIPDNTLLKFLRSVAVTFSPTLVFNFITHIDVYYYQQLIRSLTIDIDINDEFADFQLGSLVPKT